MKRVPLVFLISLLLAESSSLASYEVRIGDTLTNIAENTYGNWVKWEDLWKVNRKQVTNPDLIYPGQRLQLLTDEQLDLYAANAPAGVRRRMRSDAGGRDGPTPVRNRNGRSQEWRILPLQSWEKYVFRMSPEIDPDGFDRRSRVAVRIADKSAADITIASDRIPVLGEITNARTEYERIFLGEQVFIRADEQLQVGTIYSVTTGPQKLVSKRDGRVGFGYDLTGKIKIVGVRDGLFIGTVIALFHPIQRHQLLIPEVADYQFVKAVAAPSPLQAMILAPQSYREDFLGEQKIVFLDVGSNEGVKPGMIFRHYLHTDPGTNETITAKEFLIESEIEVLSVLDKFSVGIILKSHSISHYGDDLTALTDLSDFERNQGLQTILQDGTIAPTVDDLDKMDTTEGLGDKENQDLRQLEKWSQPVPDTLPAPTSDENDEIQRLDTRSDHKNVVEIGNEVAPNDGTSSKPQTAPDPAVDEAAPQVGDTAPAPEPTPTPAPEATPSPPTDNPPPLVDSLGPSIESSTAPTNEPPPIMDTNPLPSADPFSP